MTTDSRERGQPPIYWARARDVNRSRQKHGGGPGAGSDEDDDALLDIVENEDERTDSLGVCMRVGGQYDIIRTFIRQLFLFWTDEKKIGRFH